VQIGEAGIVGVNVPDRVTVDRHNVADIAKVVPSVIMAASLEIIMKATTAMKNHVVSRLFRLAKFGNIKHFIYILWVLELVLTLSKYGHFLQYF